jgi:hypothetical protein
MYFFLIGLAVWIAPAVLLVPFLLFAVFGHPSNMQQPSLEQLSHHNDDHAPENAADWHEREVALPLVFTEADGGRKSHPLPVAEPAAVA